MAIELNDNIDNKSPKILDKRYSTDGVTPYVDVAAANAAIPLSYRALGLPVLIGNVEYWYRDGIQDADLVEKTSGGGHIIQDNNVDLPNQPKLNVSGISLKAQDNNPNSATDLFFTGKVCGLEIQPLNFTFGTIVDFTKQDYVPNIDIISTGLQITRDDSGEWLFNPLAEVSATPTSPTNSSWYGNITNGQQFIDAISNLSQLPYDTFSNAVINSIGSFDNLVGTLWIMKDDYDKYWAVSFIGWTVTQAGQKATNQFINGLADDGTIVTIGSRNYTYNLSLDQWTNDELSSYALLVDAINNDSLKEVDAFPGDGVITVYALNEGIYGNSIATTITPPAQENILWVFGDFLINGIDAIGGGGFQYQRAEILVLCNGNISFPDGTSQNTAPSKIQNEGVTLPTRPFIDFVGAAVDVDDFGGKTRVTINGTYRKIINVDANYGDFVKASLDPYNQDYSFPSLEMATAIAQPGDLIFVSPGNYTPNGNIAKDGVDWYFCPNAIVSGSSPFALDAASYNVYGYGTFINTGFASPFFFVRFGGKVNITCNKFINQANYYGCVYVEHNFAEVNFTCFGEVDCSYNLSIAFTADYTGKLTINAPIVRTNYYAYLALDNDSVVIANVQKTIMYDSVGGGGIYAGSSNAATNTLIIINGDLFTAQTIDKPGSAINFWNGCQNCVIVLNGATSQVRLPEVVNNTNCPNCHTILLSQVENIQETGKGVYMNTGKVTIKNKLKNSDLSTSEVITIDGGQVILDNAVLVCGVGAIESVVAPAPTTIKVYSAYTNKPLSANVTNSIIGTNVIIDAGVE